MSKFSIGQSYSSKATSEFIESQHKDIWEDFAEAAKPNEMLAADGTLYVLDAVGDVKESTTPTVKGQYKKEGLWRYGTPKATVLNLSIPKDLSEYNEILAKASGEDPGCAVLESSREFYQGEFFVMLTWCPILYASLMRKTK